MSYTLACKNLTEIWKNSNSCTLQLLRIFGAKIIVYSIRGHKYICSMHGRGETCMIHAWRGETHACIMHGWKNHACSMDGMVDVCMYHTCIMHDTCIHAWDTLKHACFMYRISSRVCWIYVKESSVNRHGMPVMFIPYLVTTINGSHSTLYTWYIPTVVLTSRDDGIWNWSHFNLASSRAGSQGVWTGIYTWQLILKWHFQLFGTLAFQ